MINVNEYKGLTDNEIIENAIKNALMQSGKFIPWRVVTISTDGKILD